MATAWVRQINAQVEKHGSRKASWYCFWIEPDRTMRRKSFGPGSKGKRLAGIRAAELNASLKLGTYEDPRDTKWSDFRTEYEDGPLSRKAPGTRRNDKAALGHFERLCKLKNKTLASITARTIEQFIEKRLKERGKKPDSTLSPASVNKDLRAIKAALNKAAKLGYIAACPPIEFLREPECLPPFITETDFAAIHEACTHAERPAGIDACDWWRGLLTMAVMTGWRIGELLSLEWRDVDLDRGFITTRAAANKGKRDGVVPLNPIVRDAIDSMKRQRRTADPRDRVFAWDESRRRLYDEFERIQKAAGIDLECRIDREHTCTDACHLYGFHDGRRAFATFNASLMSREALRVLMRHQSEQTTARYINYTQQIEPAAQQLHVPHVLRMPSARAE